MADIPLLELSRIGLEVKLKRQRVAPVGEGLVLIIFVRRQPHGVTRQIERIAVPMQNDGIVVPERLQARRLTFPGQMDGAPADFLDGSLEDLSAKRLGHELAAKA